MKTIAILGCGKATTGKEGWAIGHAHAHGYRNCGQDVQLLGVDLSPENLDAFGDTFDLPAEQLFASTEALYAACTPDVVSICTWPALHHPMVMEAMEKGVKGIAWAFGDLTGEPVRVVDAATRGLKDTDVNGVDAILLYHTQAEANADTRRILETWVSRGKPLMITHAGLGAWPDWDLYQTWCGHAWEWGVSTHPYEPCELNVTEGDPLGFGWHSAWLPRDEVFVMLKERSKVDIGLTATISIGDFPAAWRLADQPNVGVWMPGHREDSWTVPAMREGAARTLYALFIKKE